MPGPGTGPVITRPDLRAVCLDVTRLVSRAGQGAPTGIDRVERRYLDRCVALDAPVTGLCRLASGLVLLDRDGMRALAARLDGTTDWGQPDRLSALSRKLPPVRQRAEADLRRLAVQAGWRGPAEARLARALPEAVLYLNTGHANLSDRTMRVLRRVAGAEIAVLLHDTIPLDHRDWQRPGTADSFATKLAVVARHADLVIAISAETEAAARRHMAAIGHVPETIRAPLGVDVAPPAAAELPPGLPPPAPYFVALGTIEPRKNHALLLDVWDEMEPRLGPACPTLVIAGRRGWLSEQVFARLDRARTGGRRIVEVADLSDGAISALLQGAAALLFPSRAEGFGLPPAEAALLGTPVLSAPLPSVRETLGNIPIYANPDDMYLWTTTIERLAEVAGRETGIGAAGRPAGIPTWQDHFKAVFTRLC